MMVVIIMVIIMINACVADGGWVLKDLGTDTNNPKPRSMEHPIIKHPSH